MIDLEKNAKESRVVWIVVADDKHIFIARSGYGMRQLGKSYKKIKTMPASVSRETADKLDKAVIHIGDI